jgi:glycosyltransferase involved in cell wall biosynthesis
MSMWPLVTSQKRLVAFNCDEHSLATNGERASLTSVPYRVAGKLECGDPETAVNGEVQLLNLQRKVHAKCDNIEQSEVERGGGSDDYDQNPATDQRDEDEAAFASPSSTFGKIFPREVLTKISLVICSHNRAIQLAAMLGKLDLRDLTRNAVEVNLIDSASTDSTREVMLEFKEKSSFPVNVGQADRPGVGLARNVGLKVSSGEVIVFTDDDCYIDANYFTNLSTLWDGQSFQYGGGQILQYDASLDSRIANLTIDRRWGVPPNTVLATGTIQGANMFFGREVFQRAGLFNENMWWSGGDDIEMATRASMHGFRGVLLPELKVLHDHGRKRGTPEADQVVRRYDFGRGAYYASLIVMGYREARELPTMAKLPREMDGALRYFRSVGKLSTIGAHRGPFPATSRLLNVRSRTCR